MSLGEKVFNKDLFEVLNENLFYGTALKQASLASSRLPRPPSEPRQYPLPANSSHYLFTRRRREENCDAISRSEHVQYFK